MQTGPAVQAAVYLARRLIQLDRMDEAEPVCYRCPECGSEDILPTVKTVTSTYCRCPKCGWLWHEERTAPPPDTTPKRRRTDPA